MEGSSWKPSIAIYQGTGFSPYFKSAILNNAASIMVAHNHPSGNNQYSPEDVEVSKRLKEAGEYIGIELLDSIIVGYKNGGLSLREIGVI